jgi:hypothetical protein
LFLLRYKSFGSRFSFNVAPIRVLFRVYVFVAIRRLVFKSFIDWCTVLICLCLYVIHVCVWMLVWCFMIMSSCERYIGDQEGILHPEDL